MTHSSAAATALKGAPNFAPNMVFDGTTVSPILFGLLLADLKRGRYEDLSTPYEVGGGEGGRGGFVFRVWCCHCWLVLLLLTSHFLFFFSFLFFSFLFFFVGPLQDCLAWG